MNSKSLFFTIFCIDNVASYLGKNTKEVYHTMQDAGIIDDYIVPCYDVLHTFSKEYIDLKEATAYNFYFDISNVGTNAITITFNEMIDVLELGDVELND